LHMFLHLGWGGVYMDAEAEAAKIRDCFSIADQIVPAAQSVGRFQAGERLLVVGSDFYGSYWLPPGESHGREDADYKKPMEVLTEVLGWLTTDPRGKVRQR